MLKKSIKFKKCKIVVSFFNSFMYETNFVLGSINLGYLEKNAICIKIRTQVISNQAKRNFKAPNATEGSRGREVKINIVSS